MTDAPSSTDAASPEVPVLVLGERRVALDRPGTWLVGRGAGCDIAIDDPSVADVHALIYVDGAQLEIEDRSSGWTFVDGVECGRSMLRPGDALVLGSVRVDIDLPRATVGMGTGTGPPIPPPAGLTAVAGDKTSRTVAIGAFFARAHGARPMREEASFAEIMADELRRAPWFALSIALHVAVLLLLLWLLPEQDVGGKQSVYVGLQGSQGPTLNDAVETHDEPVTIEQADLPPLEPVAQETFDEPPMFEDSFDPDTNPNLFGSGLPTGPIPTNLGLRRPPSIDLLAGGEGMDNGGFRKTVADLNAHGLELVFVFDSTGSMDHVLDAAKARIARTLDVLQALVHGARVGVVTYRDSGPREAYLTRSIPLDDDFYRAANFVQTIQADGGGDEPEAVFDGLHLAMTQSWRPKARRVIVLIGDAQAHERNMKVLEKELRRFSADGLSQVHTLVTPRSRFTKPVASAVQNFERIATAGRGEAIAFEDESTLLKQVLTLAFGREFRKNVDWVYSTVDRRRSAIDGTTAEIAANPDQLTRALRQRPIEHAVVQAAIERMTPATGKALARILGERKFPAHGRHAASYILQRKLDLAVPPLNPDTAEALPRGAVQALERQVIEALRR